MTTPPVPPAPGSPSGASGPEPDPSGHQGAGQPPFGSPPQPGAPQPGAPQPGAPQPGAPKYGTPPQQGVPQQGMPPYGAPSQPGMPPYGAPPQPGQPPYGAPPYGAPPIGTPPPKKKRTVLWVFLALGLVAIVAIGALVALGIAGTKDDVDGAGDVAIGDCVKVTGTERSDDLKATKASCDATGTFTFYVATKTNSIGETCPNEDYSRLYWKRSRNSDSSKDQQLCLVPNLVAEKCYSIPSGAGGSLSDFAEVPCGTPGQGGNTVARVSQRTTSQPSCASGELEVFFQFPRPVGYCLESQTAS